MHIVIGSAASSHTTATRAATTSLARTSASNDAQKETTAAIAARKLTSWSVWMPGGNCTPCKVLIWLRPCEHRHRVISSRAHNSIKHGDHKLCKQRSNKAAWKHANNIIWRSTQTHKVKRLNARRELHSFQGDNLIVTLCSSSSGHQLARTQQHHARWSQALQRSKKAWKHTNNIIWCSTQTHKVKRLNARRELHSFQGDNLIEILCKLSSSF
jgi:hypothetical protein